MTNDPKEALTFVATVRTGLAGAFPTGSGRHELSVSVNGTPLDTALPIELAGPGHVTGLRLREGYEVIRTYPAQGAEAEWNYLAHVEFDRPDLPWMFSPKPTSPTDPLSPWIVLIVVEQPRDSSSPRVAVQPPTDPELLPRVTVNRAELQPLSESHLWAHVQLVADADNGGEPDVQAAWADPRRSLSRLICPRRLTPHREYLACVVPGYLAGVHAGLGQPSEALKAGTTPAWSGGQGSIELPVYFSWTFTTSNLGDFESLARALKPTEISSEQAFREVDLSDSGMGLPPATTSPLMGGALRPVANEAQARALDTPFAELPNRTAQDAKYVDEFTRLIRRGAAAPMSEKEYVKYLKDHSGQVPELSPPVYGRHPPQAHDVTSEDNPANAPPPWIGELNLDPRRRVAAALGAEAVRRQQEDLMREAWEQVGDVRAANQLIDQTVLARELGASLHRRVFAQLGAEDLLTITASIHPKVTISNGQTLSGRLRTSQLPGGMATPMLRRLTRPGGALRRSLIRRGQMVASENLTAKAVAKSLDLTAPLVKRVRQLDGINQLEPITKVLPAARAAAAYSLIVKSDPAVETLSEDERARELQRIGGLFTSTPLPRASEFRSAVLDRDALDPEVLLAGLGVVERKTLLEDVQTSGEQATSLLIESDDQSERAGRIRFARSAVTSTQLGKGFPELLERETIRTARRDGITSANVLTSLVKNRTGFVAIADTERIPLAPVTVAKLSDAFADEYSRVLEQVFRNDLTPKTLATAPIADVGVFRDAILNAIDPTDRAGRKLAALIKRPAPAPVFDRVMHHPRFRRPAIEMLSHVSPEWVLPGISDLPPNSVALVEVDRPFVAAYMVGLNHEMGRELLWRDYPTDLRGTYFDRVWRNLAEPDRADLVPLHTATNKHLPELLNWQNGNPLVLTMRGDLLHRYPGTLIVAAQTKQDGPRRTLDADTIKAPDLFSRIEPDIYLLGFTTLTSQQVLSSEGGAEDDDWWFFFIEQFAEPKFGFDIPRGNATPLSTWNDAAWSDDPAEQVFLTSTTFSGAYPRRAPASGSVPAKSHAWASNSAAQAWACLQSPFRIGIKATELLPRPIARQGGGGA